LWGRVFEQAQRSNTSRRFDEEMNIADAVILWDV